jgi:hypothetical protein
MRTVVTTPLAHAQSWSVASAAPVRPRPRAQSSIRPAAAEALAFAIVHRAVRRPKYRPRTRRGTSSAIHDTQALLPRMPSTAATAATASRIPCPVRSDTGRNGSATSGNITCRDGRDERHGGAAVPRRAVLHAAGIWKSCAICGSETTRPVRKRPRAGESPNP